MAIEITTLGDSAFVIRVADSLGEVLEVARQLERAKIAGVTDIAPAFASVGVFFKDPGDKDERSAALHAALRRKKHFLRTKLKSRTIEIPVCYDPEFALDLEAVAQYSGFSPNEVVTFHASALYQVRCVGFSPGFPYLSGLPAALAMPRRATPRVTLPAGSVAIGGRQTGIYPLASPGGWNIIGRTPLRLFDPSREPAAILRTGDRVRFKAMPREDFERWGK